MKNTEKNKSPAYQWYPKDALTDKKLIAMTLSQEAIYRRLLDYAWLENGLDNDMALLAAYSKMPGQIEAFKEEWKIVKTRFSLIKGKWKNTRQETERKKQKAWKKKSSDGGNTKWQSPESLACGKKNRSQRLVEARRKGTHSIEEWNGLVEFFGCCVRCGETPQKLFKDHIIPIYQGGSDSIKNIQPLCPRCSSMKGPENTDHRPMMAEKLGKKWLPEAYQDACQMPTLQSSSPSSFASAKINQLNPLNLKEEQVQELRRIIAQKMGHAMFSEANEIAWKEFALRQEKFIKKNKIKQVFEYMLTSAQNIGKPVAA